MEARGRILEARGRTASKYIFLELASQMLGACKIWGHSVHWRAILGPVSHIKRDFAVPLFFQLQKRLKNYSKNLIFKKFSNDLKNVSRHCGGHYNIKIRHFDEILGGAPQQSN